MRRPRLPSHDLTWLLAVVAVVLVTTTPTTPVWHSWTFASAQSTGAGTAPPTAGV